MESNKDIVIVPAPKAARGFTSSIDVSDTFILSFNGNSVVLRPHNAPNQSLVLNHVSDIMAARFSHDGKLLASIDAKGTLIISEPIPDRIIEVYQYHGVFPSAKYIDWSADRKKICVVGEGKNKFAKVISIDTGVQAGQIGGVSTTLNSCSFRPQRPYKLVLGGDEFDLKGYDGPPYKFTKSEKIHNSFINHVRYSPKGSFIVSGGADRRLVIYDGKTYQKISQKLQAHNGGIYGLDWIDDDHFVTVSSDKLIKIWSTKFQQKALIQGASSQDIKNQKKYSSFLVAVKAFKDKIYVSNIDGDILIYNNPLSKDNNKLTNTISGNRSKISTILPFKQNNLILLDSGGRILNFDIKKEQLTICASEIDMNGILNGFVHQENNRLFVLTNNGAIWIYQGETPQLFKLVKMLDGIQFKHISQGSKSHQIVGISNNKLFIFDFQSQKIVDQRDIDQDFTELQSNKHFILAGTVKGKVHVFNSSLKPIEVIKLNTFKITTLCLFDQPQPSVYRCLMGDACGKMSMIQISQQGVKQVKQTMGGHASVITGGTCLGSKLYTFSMDGKVCIWNKQSLMREDDIKNPVNGGILCGSSIGQYLVISGNDMITKLIKKGK